MCLKKKFGLADLWSSNKCPTFITGLKGKTVDGLVKR